jgi:hypothetical protein
MELGLGQFGDLRLASVGALCLARLIEVGQSGTSVRKLGGNRAGEIRLARFLHNPRVTHQEMTATAAARTAERARGRHVLAIQDSTTLRDDGGQNSLLLHATIAVDAQDGAVLGPVDASFLQRQGGQKVLRKQRPFVEKQSHRWLQATHAAQAALLDAACVTVVADREGDIYEEFAERPKDVQLVIRAAQDRALAGGQMLFECLNRAPVLGRERIMLPAAPGRPARAADITLRARTVALRRPGRLAAEKHALPAQVSVWLVEAREENPPPGLAAVHWRLLTTHAVRTAHDACQIVGIYRQRWTIEQLFRVMKTKGFDVEALRTMDARAHANLTAAIFIAAVQVLQLVRERDCTAARPMEDILDLAEAPAVQAISASLEGGTARQKNPHPPDSLAFVSWVCARLGGWTGYYGKPGPVVMLNGLLQLKTMLKAMKLQRHV